jgi:hypothetical protein
MALRQSSRALRRARSFTSSLPTTTKNGKADPDIANCSFQFARDPFIRKKNWCFGKEERSGVFIQKTLQTQGQEAFQEGKKGNEKWTIIWFANKETIKDEVEKKRKNKR